MHNNTALMRGHFSRLGERTELLRVGGTEVVWETGTGFLNYPLPEEGGERIFRYSSLGNDVSALQAMRASPLRLEVSPTTARPIRGALLKEQQLFFRTTRMAPAFQPLLSPGSPSVKSWRTLHASPLL